MKDSAELIKEEYPTHRTYYRTELFLVSQMLHTSDRKNTNVLSDEIL